MINVENSKIPKANALLRDQKWEDAINLYNEIIKNSPEFFKILKGNIDFATRRLESKKRLLGSTFKTNNQTTRKRIFLDDLYNEVKEKSDKPVFEKKTAPLVSIIVTSFNTEEYIEACLESLISQSYPNIEIIVVDDLSSDFTIQIIQRISKANSGIKLIRLASNLGTYFAKNYGIKVSCGQYIFFQDSDDICHPDRISLLMEKLLANPHADIIRGAYSRIDPLTSEVIPVNGFFSKLGLITLGIKKEVICKIGYFNCTTKASDDEFFNRAIHFLGKKNIVNLDLPLYYNTMREGSLFADMIHWNDDGSIQQKPSPVRQSYVETFKAAHANMTMEQAPKIFSFPTIRDSLNVFSEMTKLANPICPVIVNVCSIPEREQTLERVLRGISRQCDEINVYLDRYTSIPGFLNKLGVPVKIYRSQDLPGLRDNGKFLTLSEISKDHTPAYYFTIDDDIDYPDDYVNSMIKHLNKFENLVVIGVHGITLKDKPDGYFSQRRMVHAFTRPLEKYRYVNILGTGTVAFHTSAIKEFNLSEFEDSGMVDLFFAKSCIIRNIPQICVPRHESWLKEININSSPTLFSEFKKDDSRQTKVLKSIDSWGMSGINKTLNEFNSKYKTIEFTINRNLSSFTKSAY